MSTVRPHQPISSVRNGGTRLFGKSLDTGAISNRFAGFPLLRAVLVSAAALVPARRRSQTNGLAFAPVASPPSGRGAQQAYSRVPS